MTEITRAVFYRYDEEYFPGMCRHALFTEDEVSRRVGVLAEETRIRLEELGDPSPVVTVTPVEQMAPAHWILNLTTKLSFDEALECLDSPLRVLQLRAAGVGPCS